MSNEQYPADFEMFTGMDDKQVERAAVKDLQEFIDTKYSQLAQGDELGRIEAREYISQAIARLDEGCSYINTGVLVSGYVQAGYYNEFEGRDAREVRNLSDEFLISRGFHVHQAGEGEDRKLQVGYSFVLPNQGRMVSDNGLIQNSVMYFAFAPYDTIAIEAQYTSEQRRNYLTQMIPDIMDEVDETVLNSESNISGLLGLRRLSYDIESVPHDVYQQLVSYVSEQAIDLKALPLLQLDLQGARSINLNNLARMTAPYDREQYTGGMVSVIGRIGELALRQHSSYVDGEIYTTDDLRWAAAIDVEAAGPEHQRYIGQTFEVSVLDIRDAYPVQPLS